MKCYKYLSIQTVRVDDITYICAITSPATIAKGGLVLPSSWEL